MDQVPIGGEAIFGGILAHRRDADAVAQGDFADSHGSQEHYCKITGPYSCACAVLPHYASMGKILVGCITAALAANAGMKDGIALNRSGHELYLAARYSEAEATYRRALQEFGASTAWSAR